MYATRMDTAKNLCYRLPLARHALGHTRWQAAKELGCSIQALGTWERGEALPGGKWWGALAQYVARARAEAARILGD